MQRQDAFDDLSHDEQHRKNKIDLKSFLTQCIPPPPSETPPRPESSDCEFEPLPEISSGTLEKLNSLYSAYKMHRSTSNETDKSDEIVYRLREFNNFSPRTHQDSCKALWSFVSVCILKYKLQWFYKLFYEMCDNYFNFSFLEC